MSLRSALAGCLGVGLLLVAACAPTVQAPLTPQPGFSGPRLESEAVVAHDGARLPLSRWLPEEEPWAVVIGLHGMNEARGAFHLAGPWWAERGVATYAYDQRGFGGAPGRGVWAGQDLLAEDLRTLAALLRARHPGAVLVVVGESMGGAVAITAFASDRPPDADRLILSAPAVWGWSSQPLANRAGLWLAARLLGSVALEPPEVVVRDIIASDNLYELYRMGRDPALIGATRFDTLHGLVDLMEAAGNEVSDLRVPTAVFYGGRDQIITADPMAGAVARLPPGARTAFYPDGHHLLFRDQQGAVVMADMLAFMREPQAAWPSGADPITLSSERR